MSHWAEINDSNIVLRVIVGNNDHSDEGYQWIIDNLGGTWIKTSYNTRGGVHLYNQEPLRKNFAIPGMIYSESLDAFIYPDPEDGSVLNEDTGLWEKTKP
jgi:hypothetical protein